MLPCRRGALLSKSAGFKKIPEDKQINHEMYAKIYPKTIQKTIKNKSRKCCGKSFEQINKNTTNFTILGPMLDPIAWYFNPVDRFIGNLVFGIYAEHFQGGFWTPKWSKRMANGAKLNQKGGKRSQNGLQKSIKMRHNDFSAHNQSTQIFVTVLRNPRKYKSADPPGRASLVHPIWQCTESRGLAIARVTRTKKRVGGTPEGITIPIWNVL